MLLVDCVGKNVTAIINKDTVYFGRVESVAEGRITLLVQEKVFFSRVSIPIDHNVILRMPQYEEWVGKEISITDNLGHVSVGVLESTHKIYLTLTIPAEGAECHSYLRSHSLLDICRITLAD